MKHKGIFCKVCIMWTFLFTVSFGMKVSSANSLATPDFAFPKEVVANSKMELDRSLQKGDPVTALRAAMQIVIADNLISTDNLDKGVALFDSLSHVLKYPYSGIASMLEARLLSDAYKRDRWTYNNRVLPLDSFPEEIKSWSRDQFAARITELVKCSLSSADRTREMPVSSIALVLSDYEAGEKAGMTLYDFMVIQGSEILQSFDSKQEIIPFSTASTPLSSRLPLVLIDENLEWNLANNKIEMAALVSEVKLNLLSDSEKNSWNDTCLNRFENTPWCAAFLIYKKNQNQEEEKLKANYDMIRNYIERYPDCMYREQLESYLADVLAERVKVEGQSQYLPGKEIRGTVKFNNLSEFYLLVVKFPNSFLGKNIKKENLASSGALVTSCKIIGDKEIPSYREADFSYDSLNPGVYAFIPSRTPDKSGAIWFNSEKNALPTFLVSSLSAIQSSDSNKEGGVIYVVEGGAQKPVKGAAVKFTPAYKWKNAKVINAITDADGKVCVPEGNYKVLITHGKNQLELGAYGHTSQESERTTLRGEILTDLSIYHPGDSLRFSAIVYTLKGQKMMSAPQRKIQLQLLDVNWQPKDTLELTTDKYGRAVGKFQIPENGLLGLYHLQMTEDNGNWCGETAVQIADYQSPTFYVETTGGEGSFAPGDDIKLHGVVKTYSGMPVDAAKVKFNVRYQPVWWWRDNGGPASYGGEALTDADGSFLILLPTEGLRRTRFAYGRYTVNIEVTDRAGETQVASPIVFSMGSAWQIRPSLPEYINADKSTEGMKVAVYDVAGFPAIKKVWYKIEKGKGQVVASGEFDSPLFNFDFTTIPSGEYKVMFSLDPDYPNDKNIVESCKIIVYRDADILPAAQTCLWLPEDKIIVSDVTKSVKIRVGSSYPDSYILVTVADVTGLLERKWIKVSEGFVSVPVDAPSEESRVKVTFAGMHELEGIVKSVTLIPEIQTKNLEILSESFRDRTSPGYSETWKFRFMLDGENMRDLPVMAVMSNKALNALRPFNWSLDPYSHIGWYFPTNISQYHDGNYYWNMLITKPINYNSKGNFVWPQFNTYGYSLYEGYAYNGIKIRGMSRKMTMAAGAVAHTSEVANEIYEDSADMTFASATVEEQSMAKESDSDQGEVIASEEEPLREVECASAFFNPDLVTDADGIATMDVIMPDFNGTWQFQIAGYTPGMKGAVLVRDVLSSKSVMASLNAPRFVRTSDRFSVSGRIFNNSVDSVALGAEISIFDPVTGKEIIKKEFAPTFVKAMGNRTVEISLEVPAEIDMIGIKLVGSGVNHRDGEQRVIPVFPSSTPVIESKTFYLAPGEKEVIISDERYQKGRVTLNYTDNPVWECVAALPSIIIPSSQNALSIADAFYGNGITVGLVEKYPVLRDALQVICDPKNSADSTLISKLERNSSLKAVSLENTPWVRDAQNQNLRMSMLHNYLNKNYSENTLRDIVSALKKLQNPDGGWSWCDGMESSGFVTRYVLSRLAMLSKAGFLPGEASAMAIKGVNFADADYVKEYGGIGNKNFRYSEVAEYLYIRSMLGDVKTVEKFETIKSLCLQEVAKEWKKTSVNRKAITAALLYRAGRKDIAYEILRSIGEYSSYSKSQGRWFANTAPNWNSTSSIETTSRVLEVIAEINPDSEMIDQLRQWLLLCLQTGDWDSGSRTMTSMIHAILTTGSEWTGSASEAKIYIKDKEIHPDKISRITGSFIIPLEDETGAIRITRGAEGPAWGGVISQYVAPIESVKAAKNDRLSIEKAIYSIHHEEIGTTASKNDLRVGDKVRITLTLKNDRDLEFVTVTDSRSACLEPAEQVSGYTMSDGIMMYKEIRGETTNLFIPYLPKGIHVIQYECFVDREGEYSLGIATAQSQYSPEITAHSAGKVIRVNREE